MKNLYPENGKTWDQLNKINLDQLNKTQNNQLNQLNKTYQLTKIN